MKRESLVLCVLLFAALGSCAARDDDAAGESEARQAMQKAVLGEVQVGSGPPTEFYIAYDSDAAILGFSVSDETGAVRYFPIFASTYRGIPSVTLDVFVSKTEDEMWVRSSWAGSEILAYHRVGADTAITQFGETAFFNEPMPERLSGGGGAFPELPMEQVVKKASFKHEE